MLEIDQTDLLAKFSEQSSMKSCKKRNELIKETKKNKFIKKVP